MRRLQALVLALLLAAPLVSAGPAEDLAKRILHRKAARFEFVEQASDTDFFLIEQAGRKIRITGNNANSQAMGLNYYLKHIAHVHVSWLAEQPVQLPWRLPKVKEPVRRETKAQEQKQPDTFPPEGEAAEEKPGTLEEQWEAGRQKALRFNLEAVDYDDEDSICLDNLGQTYYRVMGDREQAQPWFEKAHALKPGQIDTLYFLSRYDLEKGDRKAALEKLEQAAEGRFSPLNYCSREEIEAEIRALKEEK